MNEFFDFRIYLEDRGISYSTSGKNVTAGWMELQCPFCGDTSKHLGVSPTGLLHCWRCGGHGLAEFIQTVDNCSYHEAKSTIEEFTNYSKEEPSQKTYSNELVYPQEDIDNSYYSEMLGYLQGRGFDKSVIEKYKLEPTGRFGKYKFRIVIPVIEDGVICTFTTRDYTGISSTPKLHYGEIQINQFLYNIDSVRDKILLVEGPTDVWKVGDGCVGTFGIVVTDEQILKLIKKKPKEVYICFDPEQEAQKKANELATKLYSFIKTVELIELPEGKDPGDLSVEEVNELRSVVGL